MPWWCDRHKQHSMDDVCGGCEKDSYLRDFPGFKAGLSYASRINEFKTESAAYDHWKEKRVFKGKLKGDHR